mgnify:CR=1 FL=1|tara:strand:- start:211 stop:372 length:162 start_codon:yes stop_codon:yes gene_type:complete
MCIQRKKAEEKEINFEVIYENILSPNDTQVGENMFNSTIKTDEQRVMQVLLGL